MQTFCTHLKELFDTQFVYTVKISIQFDFGKWKTLKCGN